MQKEDWIYFHFKKTIRANLYTNFDGAIISGKNPGVFFAKHVLDLQRIKLYQPNQKIFSFYICMIKCTNFERFYGQNIGD